MSSRMMLAEKGATFDALRARLAGADLDRHVVDLELLGYTVLPEIAPPAFIDELRDAILRAAREDVELDRARHLTPNTQTSFQLLGRGRVFEQAVLAPRALLLMEYLLGTHFQLSSVSSNIIGQGAASQPLHSDSTFVPAPLPSYAQIVNVLWCCDDFTRAGGATLVVPGSHRLCTHPPADSHEGVVAVECPRGSAIVLHGNTWHSGGARTLRGERVALLAYYSRMHLRAQENYYDLPDEVLARNPEVLRRLIGRANPYARPDRFGPDVESFLPALLETQHPGG